MKIWCGSVRGIETVTIIRRSTTGTRDEYGMAVHTTANVTVNNVLVAFDQTNEPVIDGRKPQDTGITLYFPMGTTINEGDEFEIRGERWLKDGRQEDWISPWASFQTGVVVKVRQRVG